MLQRNITLIAMVTQEEKDKLEKIALKRGLIRSGKGNLTQGIVYLINKEHELLKKK